MTHLGGESRGESGDLSRDDALRGSVLGGCAGCGQALLCGIYDYVHSKVLYAWCSIYLVYVNMLRGSVLGGRAGCGRALLCGVYDCVHSKVLYAWYSIYMLTTGVVRPVEELLMLYAAEAQGLYHRL